MKKRPFSASAVEVSYQPDQERVVIKLYDGNENLTAYAKLQPSDALQVAGRLTLATERLREANTITAEYRRIN